MSHKIFSVVCKCINKVACVCINVWNTPSKNRNMIISQRDLKEWKRIEGIDQWRRIGGVDQYITPKRPWS